MSIWNSLFGGMFKTKAKLENKPKKINHGSSWNSPNGARNPFSPTRALQTYSQHGYLYAAITRASEDLSALPLKLIKGKGKNAIQITEHPLLDLLEQPSVDVDGYLFRQQLYLDLIMSGSCYSVMLGLGKTPDSIVRLHPGEIEIITNEFGLVGYEHTSGGSSVEYPPERILTARNASYAKGNKSLYGTGAVQSLNRELIADFNAQNLTTQATSSGHPDILLSPKDGDVWPAETRRQISDNYSKLSRSGGVMVLSGECDVTPLNLKPSDMEYQAVRKQTMQIISACIGTPPSILGGQEQNYATSRQQALNYWDLQQKRAKRINIMLNKLARLYDKDLRIEHDFSSVEALQSVRDSKLQRVQMLIMSGVSPADAFAYEGMEDVPIGPSAKPDEPEEIVIDERSADTIIRLFEDHDQTIKKKWNSHIATRHGPAERKLKRAYSKYLNDAKKRYVSRFRKYIEETEVRAIVNGGIIQKDLSVIDWSALEAKGFERKEIYGVMEKLYGDIYQSIGEEELDLIYEKAEKERPQSFQFGNSLKDLLNRSATFISDSTAKAMRKVVDKSKKEGLSKSEVLDNVFNHTDFAFPRVQRIATTEATKTINDAIAKSADQAQRDGIQLMKQWISQQDNRVRPAHQAFAAQPPIPTNEKWIWEDETGIHQAEYPGGFESDGLTVNCRCTFESVVVAADGGSVTIE
tara:strand:- start:2329 stop:4407 length:2079 start_codon:yes stop_codon:yes gene_type:complete